MESVDQTWGKGRDRMDAFAFAIARALAFGWHWL